METEQLPSLDSLPDHIRLRIQRGSMLFADAHFCARYFDPPRDSAAFSLRVADLLSAGMTWADCQWMWMAGYLADARSIGRGQTRSKARRAPSRLSEHAWVTLTAAGEAELRRFQLAGAIAANLAERPYHTGGDDQLVPIRYDRDMRELFLGNIRVLRLGPTARNMHVLLKHFDDELWRKQIRSPFETLTNSARAQAVRDAVHGLNKLQDPLHIVFRSNQKGARIFYEIADYDVAPRLERIERYGRAPLVTL